jgi:dihydrofolate reductase
MTKENITMRKLKLQVQMTVDGYIAGLNGEMDFMVSNWDDELKQYVEDITEPVDCIILGRKLAEGFIPYWASVAANSAAPEFTSGKKFTNTHKVVFTKTLDKSEWDNTVLAKGNLVDEITQLKKQYGKDIIAYGSATFVSALIKQGWAYPLRWNGDERRQSGVDGTPDCLLSQDRRSVDGHA